MSIRTLIVDDMVVYRKILSEAASAFPDVEVVGTAASGAIALKKMTAEAVDLVFLDVHMPEMNGVETLAEIRKKFPETIVIMVSGVSTRSTKTTITALEMGALEFIRKPEGNNFSHNLQVLHREFEPVIRLAAMRLNMRGVGPDIGKIKEPLTKKVCKAKGQKPAHVDIMVIGCSTGGPEALGKVIPSLPADCTVPIVIVQHMPPQFTSSLAESLDKKSRLRVKEAGDNEEIKPGVVYIAPGGIHTVVKDMGLSRIVKLVKTEPVNSCRPSVDVLFKSVAETCGTQSVLALILTGMGKDGLAGVHALKEHSCFCITQSAKSCIVYGMPRAIDEAGLSDMTVDIEMLGEEIRPLVG